MIRNARPEDAGKLAGIYNHYIHSTIITFETEPVTAADLAERIQHIRSAGLPWLVAEEDGQPVGYAYASPWRSRPAYRHSVEVTVYLDREARGRGWGSLLYQQLFDALRSRSIRAAIGGIALPNPASVTLHEKMGMRKVAHFNEVGYKFDRWIDVGYWQCLLDRNAP